MLLVGIGVGVLICVLLGLITHSPARFLLILLFGAIGYIATKPIMADGSTALQIIKYMQRHKRSQKLYLFQKGGS